MLTQRQTSALWFVELDISSLLRFASESFRTTN